MELYQHFEVKWTKTQKRCCQKLSALIEQSPESCSCKKSPNHYLSTAVLCCRRCLCRSAGFGFLQTWFSALWSKISTLVLSVQRPLSQNYICCSFANWSPATILFLETTLQASTYTGSLFPDILSPKCQKWLLLTIVWQKLREVWQQC